MPIFKVIRKFDAWQCYSKEFEANTAEEARVQASTGDEQYSGEGWTDIGVEVFDHVEYEVENEDGETVGGNDEST